MGSSPCKSTVYGRSGAERSRRLLGGPAAGEQGQGAPAGGLDQEGQLLVEGGLGLRGPAVGQVARHVEEGMGAVVEGAAHVELAGARTAPARPAPPGGAARWRWSTPR